MTKLVAAFGIQPPEVQKNSKQIKTVFWVQDDREPASTQQFISLSPTDETLTRPKGNKKKKYPNIGYVSLA